MSPEHDPRKLIEAAFAPEGPIYDGPKSLGRRKYDKTWWYVRIVKEVGFPIVAAWWLAMRLIPALDDMRDAVDRNSRLVAALICKLDPSECTRTLDQKATP